jgi:SPP1 gp7 family putative phage head morphogenesis protein
MAWKVTADVERYDEALSHFLGRTVLTDEQRKAIPEEARQNAFWVAGPLQADQVQHVFDEIERAIEKGESFADWRKRVRDELTNDAHAETVFRNATQSAYNAGRYAQMMEPSVLRFRPYGIVDAILDDRTTGYCETVDGTLLPLDDPWWDTHYFPAHHRCRTSVRNLRRSEAERRGITTTAPTVSPAPGWGLSPKVAQPYRPDPSRYDTGIAEELRAKEPVQPPPEETPRRTLSDVPLGTVPRQPRIDEDKFEAKARRVAQALDAESRQAIEAFSFEDYTETRDAQRLAVDAFVAAHPDKGASGYERLRQRALTIQTAIEDHGGDSGGPAVLFRGVALKREAIGDIINGSHVVADSVSSTSRSVDVALQFAEGLDENGKPYPIGVLFKLKNQHSGNTLPVERVSFIPIEREILVGAGKRYRIERVERVDMGNRELVIVHAEEVGPDAYILPNRVIRLQR